jgi:spoIIIJ-associated protein
MESLEVHGKTVEEATMRGLERLGLSRDAIEVTIIREGRSGIFGLGSEDAIIKIIPKKENLPQRNIDTELIAKNVLDKLLVLLGLDGTIQSETQLAIEGNNESPVVSLNIKGGDLGILIGRRGQTLSALQYIVRLMIGRQSENWMPVVIDVENYKQRRAHALKNFALEMADRVKARGAPFTLEPMPPYERRIIHIALASHNFVYTESIGQGEERKVIIRPKK